MATALGLGKGAQQNIPTVNFANGLALSGPVRNHLDTVTKPNELEWSIQDESLQIFPKKETLLNSLVELSPQSGLIGSPSKTDKGVEFKSLIQPPLVPGKEVKLTSKYINGVFKLRKVTHDGDSHEGTFLSECEATA